MGKEDKAFFDKKIVYLDYLERGEKIKNGGFVKWDVRGEDCRIQIHIRGLYTTDTMQGEIKLISGTETYEADRIGLQYGTGEYTSHWKNSDLAGTGVTYAECDGILIRLSDTRVLRGQWREREKAVHLETDTVETPQLLEAAEASPAEVVETSQPVEAAEDSPAEVVGTPQPIEVTEVSPVAEVVETSQTVEAAESSPALEVVETSRSEEAAEVSPALDVAEPSQNSDGEEELKGRENSPKQQERPVSPLSPDKWVQLGRIYPKIHPFGDNREYLSITPRDFIVLTRQHQELVQNSFLLHGYYNYGHLILTKIVEQEEERYYLGVPGVYYDREKQAALMFGFEGFEAGTDKMEDGGFGYYMKRVEI